VQDQHGGKRITCKQCKRTITIPAAKVKAVKDLEVAAPSAPAFVPPIPVVETLTEPAPRFVATKRGFVQKEGGGGGGEVLFGLLKKTQM
jgi:hypothetical protein